jgi:hypothetical protein
MPNGGSAKGTATLPGDRRHNKPNTNQKKGNKTMNDSKKAVVIMFCRVDEFGKSHALVPANEKATEHYATVANMKTAMLAKAGLQVLSNGEFRAAVAERKTVVSDLREKLREIAATANALDRLGVKPGLAAQFRMPKWTMQDLRDKAVAFKDAVEPIKQDFIDYESPATIVEDLQAAITAFDDVTGRRYAGLGKQVGATASIAAMARMGIAAVRALDAILIKRYRNDPGTLAEWKAAQRIARWPAQAGLQLPSAPPSEGGGAGGTTPPPSGS